MSDIMITVDSSQVIRARQELKQTADQALETLRASKKLTGEDRLAQHFATIDRQISKTNAAMSQANRRFAESQKGARSFELGIQQAGYQIGDFAVQVQSGTNPLVAFSQQFAQLAGFLGPWGAALGAVTAIIAGFGVYFMKASEGVDALSKSMEDLSKNTQQAKDELFALKLGYENAAQGAAISQIIDLEVEAASLRQQAMQEEGLRAQYLANQALELEKQAAAARKALEENKNANKELDRGRASQESMTLSAQAALDKYSKMRTVAAQVANELSRGADEAFRLAQQRITASGLVYSGRGGDPRTSNQQGYGKFVYTGPALDENNNIIPTKTGGGKTREDRLRKEIGLTKELTRAEKDRQTIVNSVQNSLENGFMAMVDGTSSVKDAFKSMAAEIIKELYKVLVVQRLVGGITNALGLTMAPTPTTTSFGTPNFFGGGRASGGSMMAGVPYLVGERGPELVIPRHSGTVVNANQTAGAMNNSGSTVVNNNISVTGSDAAMVRAEVAKMIPQITNATKAAVIDAKQRGGQMAAAFR